MWYVPAGADCVFGSSSGGEILQTCSLRLWEAGIGTRMRNQVIVFSVLCRRQRGSMHFNGNSSFFQFWCLKGSAEPRGPPFNDIGWTSSGYKLTAYQGLAFCVGACSSIEVLLRCTLGGAGLASHTQLHCGAGACRLALLASL